MSPPFALHDTTLWKGCAVKAHSDLDEDGTGIVYTFRVGEYAGGTTSTEIEY
jgi:hypothetical protein